ncbi:MAG: ABC transporter ATP-binding protein [Planctomycetaceae bacterium]|jgi:putative ABC transport system ATP-binding protein
MKMAAQVIDLQKHYDLGPVVVKALRGVSLDFPEGDFVAIMGSSGSGKSTLLNLLGGLDRPTSGKYILGGEDVSQMDDTQLSTVRNQKIGFIFQSYNLISQYTVLENIELPLHYRPGHPKLSPTDREKCERMAQRVGLGQRLDHRPFQLSGGQQQRVAIARAMMNDPEIILADEATGNLDSVTSIEIMTLLRNLNDEGRTIIMVTHEPDIAMWAKRQLVMRDGVLFKEIINEVRTTPQSALAAKEDKAFVDDEVAKATLAALPKSASADPGVGVAPGSGAKKNDNSSKKK